jgi:hypothetical protein
MSIIKSILFPEKSFATREELFACLKENEQFIIDCKKVEINSIEKCEATCFGLLKHELPTSSEALKSIGFNAKNGYIYPIISTTNWFDSHKDVHFDPCFNKTIKDQQGQVYYCADHNLSLQGIVAKKNAITMVKKNIPWSLVGKDYTGTTTALIFEIAEKDVRADALDFIKATPDLQNSIRMQYVNIKMGVDSNDKAYIENKAYYDLRINDIANKDEVEKDGYFFGVEELKIHKEGSLVVIGGSNSATSIYIPKEAVTDTSKQIEPLENTQTIANKNNYLEMAKSIRNLKK